MAIGFDIVIPDTLLKKITDADDKLQALAITAEDTQKRVNSAFKAMVDGDLNDFIKKLEQVNKEVSKLGDAKLQIDSTNTTKNIDDINKLVAALDKLSTTQKKTSQGKNNSNSIIPIPKADEWNNLQKSIQQSEKRVQELTRSTREYEATLKRIQSGKGGVLSTQDQKQYAANKAEIDELNKSIALQRQKQQEIVNQNKAIQEQIKLRESLKKYHLDQKSLPNQRSDNELKAMREYYKELEKTSAKKQKEWDKQLQTYTKKKEQEAKAAEKAEERKRKAEEKTRIAEEKKLKKTQLPDIIKPSNATIGYNPKSVNQLITAINKLKKAQNDLDITDRDYLAVKKAMNYEIEKHKKKLKELGINIDNIKQKSSNLMNISEQLTRRLALVFSVSQVTGYVKKLASVRGEFELQQKALASIIQNKDKANEIFDKVTKLAVQSPFQLKELVTYTKQLAAYKIETGKLYDNVKMLADISSGVGVDMSRLVLAYGQVASANYLRGTELRQFSEAGINVLGGLADYFTELKGRAIGVAEVFDMVSKRMVKFSDVEEVLRRMTEEGGEFYNMQAIQAQTLRGQISNLKDSIDIMLNEIGKSHEGTLKGSVALVKDLVENWRVFASVLQDVSFALVIKGAFDLHKGFKIAKDDLGSFIEEAKGLPKVAASIKKMFFDIKNAIVAHPYIAAAIAIGVVARSLYDYNKRIEEVNKQYIDAMVVHSNAIDKVQELGEKYNEYANIIRQSEETMANERNKSKIKTDEYLEAQKVLNLAQKEQKDILSQLKNEYPELYANLNAEKTTTEELAVAIEKYNNAKRMQMQINYLSQGGWFKDDLKKNITDAEEALTEYDIQVNNVSGSLLAFRARLELQANSMNSTDYERVISAFNELQKAAKKGVVENEEWTNSYKKFENILQETGLAVQVFNAELGTYELIDSKHLGLDDVTKEIENATNEWYGLFGDVTSTLKSLFDGNFKKLTSTFQNEWNKLGVTVGDEAGQKAAYEFFSAATKEMNIQHPLLMKKIKKWFEENVFGFEFEPPKSSKDSDMPKLEWVQRVYDDLENIKRKMPEDIAYLQTLMGDVTFDIALPKNQENYEEYYKEVERWVNKIREVYNKALNDTDKLINPKETENLKNALSFAEEYLKTLGGGKQKKEEDSTEKYSEQIRVLKELHKSYIDLNDIFDETTSKKGAVEKFSNAFKEAFNVDIDTFWEGLKDDKGLQLDFTTEEGIVAAFDKLIRSIPDQKKRVQAELAKAEFIMEYRIQAKKDADQQLKDEVQKFFDNYEMKVELDKLGISGDFANALFGIESMDLDKLRENLTSKEDKFIGRGMEKEYKAFQDKLTEIEVKARQERMKGYLEYTRTTISQRAQLELKAMRDLADARKDIQDKEVLSQVESGIQKKLSEDLDKLNWEAFKSSDVFVKIFNDLDNVSQDALESMIKQLNDYKDEWKNLPIQEMKEVATQLEKMEKALAMKKAGDSPFSYASIRTFGQQAKSREEVSNAQKELLKADKLLLKYKSQEESLQTINQLVNEKKDATQAIEEYNAKYGTNLETQWADQQDILNMTKEQTDELQKLAKKETERKKNAQGIVDANEAYLFALQKQHQYLGDTLQMANDLYGAFESVLAVCDEWGAELDESVAIFAQAGMDMTNTVIQTIQLQIQLNIAAQEATGLGVAMNTAMSVIGWIVMAVQLLTTALSAIAKAHDNSLQKQIERDAEAVELLQKRFEKLEDAIDNAMSFGQYQKEFDEAKRNLDEQIRLTKDMIALEEDKKKTDKDAIKGYKDEIEDYNEQLKEMEEKRYEDMGGFGSDEAYKDAAESFIDAWLSAYKETGDGLEALQDQWDEYFDNLVKKQMMMHISNKYIKGLLEQVDKAIGANGIVTGDEMANLKAMAEQSSIELNAIMKQFADALGIEGLTDGTKLEGLSESIQGVTEVTAQALEAILNSMRFYVIDNNTQQKRLVEIMESWETPTSPILAELKAQTSYLSSIESLFNSVVDRNGSPAVRVR